MKKLLSIAAAGLLLFCASFQASAIEGPDPVGSVTASAHLGFYPGVGANVSADYVLINKWWKGHFTVGAYAGFYNTKKTKSINTDYAVASKTEKDFNLTIMPRATYGLNITDSFEVHAGTMAGVLLNWNRTNSKITSETIAVGKPDKTSEISPDFAFAELVGCRYFISDNFGFTAEMGYGNISYLNVGFSYRF